MQSIIDQLNYEMFLAEQSMKMELKRIDTKAKTVTEATDIIILNEAVSDVIRKYIIKIAGAIQKAWNNFKAKIDNERIHALLDKNGKYLSTDMKMKLPVEFEIPNVDNFNELNAKIGLADHELNAGNYMQMKEYLGSTEAFYQQYYKDIYEQDKSIMDVFEEKCFTKAKETDIVDNTLAMKYSTFLLDYNKNIKLIQDDIDAINKANQNIDNLLKQVVGESSVYIGNYFILTEVGPNDNNPGQTPTPPNPQDEKDQFRNADPNAPKKESGQDRKNIVTYYKAMTQILSAKMRTCNKIKNNSIKILSNYIKLQGGQVGIIKNNPEKQYRATANEVTNKTIPQVK